MRKNLSSYHQFQVFLNYPFDIEFDPLAHAMHFAVVAAGMLPVCAMDLSVPDRPRLETLVDAIINCEYSAHDFSRSTGDGDKNFARFNMPIEMGMALFHALETQRHVHRCVFFVNKEHDYKQFASDLSGLDPKYYFDELSLVGNLYDWLRGIGGALVPNEPTSKVKEKYTEFKTKLNDVKGSGKEGRPNHDEAQEVMFQFCADGGWWDFRGNKAGRIEFPPLPLSWKIE
jgi:hypothetical protein